MITPGASVTLTSVWYAYPGGPAADLDNVQISILPADDDTPIVGPTSTGVAHPAVGVYTYTWAVPGSLPHGDYIAVWTGEDADDETLTATELLGVGIQQIDYTTDAGQVRLLIPDTDPANQILDDDQINAFLNLEGGPKRAAAAALETIASNEVMVSKVIKTQDLSTDGARTAEALLKRAAALRAQADDRGDGEGDDGGAFDIIDFADPFTRRWGEGVEQVEC